MRASVVLLAGGEATRLPGKLGLASAGVPLVVRVYRNIASDREIVLSRGADFDRELLAQLPIASIVDRYERRGPLGGLLSAMATLTTPRVFAIAADMPNVDAALLDRIEAAWQPGDEAVVPGYDLDGERHIEPLAALYDRLAFIREGTRVLEDGRGSVRRVVERLKTRLHGGEERSLFTNLNTPADYAALQAKERQPA